VTRAALGLLFGLGLSLALAACRERHEPTPAPPPAAMANEEIQRSRDACAAYVTRVCKCSETNATLVDQCKLARALPEAMKISVEVAASPDSKRQDVLGAQSSVRKIFKECIDQTAQLASVGCL
jgi:hypothetical protein